MTSASKRTVRKTTSSRSSAPSKNVSIARRSAPDNGLTAANLTVTTPATAKIVTPGKGTKQYYMLNGTTKTIMEATQASYTCTFKAPNTKWMNSTGKGVPLFTITFSTNDRYLPTQTANFVAGANTQFGNAAASGN